MYLLKKLLQLMCKIVSKEMVTEIYKKVGIETDSLDILRKEELFNQQNFFI